MMRLARSLVGSVCSWLSVYCDHQPIVRNIAVFVSSMSILGALYAADVATERLRVCNMESTTATMPYWEGCSVATQRRFKQFYAYCQFMATLACLSMANPCWAFSVMSVRDATYRRTNQLTVPRSVERSSAFIDRAAANADRCDAYVPICRGRCFPVTVSIPSTRTTHLSRCFRTVG